MQCNQLDREMEEIERNHRVDIRVYLQKVKHLQFEHKSNGKTVKTEDLVNFDEENATYQERYLL